MNERIKKYYRWRIESILRRKFNHVTKVLNIITPTYDLEKRSQVLQNAIHSITTQTSHQLKIIHIIVSNEVFPLNTLPELPSWYTVKNISPQNEKRYSTDYRNAGLGAVSRGWVMLLSDSNELLPGTFTAIERNLNSRAGTILFRVQHLSTEKAIPFSDSPTPADSSSLALLVNSDIAWIVDYQHRLLRDFQYIENIRAMSAHYGYENHLSEEIIGIDRDAVVISNDVLRA